jgi:hypothetical protein
LLDSLLLLLLLLSLTVEEFLIAFRETKQRLDRRSKSVADLESDIILDVGLNTRKILR